MIYRLAPRYKPWWDTRVAEGYELKGLATVLVGRAVAFLGTPMPANDRDHIRW